MDTAVDLDESVLCLVGLGTEIDDLTLRFADRLAEAIEAPLTVHPTPQRGAVDWPPGIELATVVVVPAYRGPLAGLLRRDRCPTLAKRLGVPAVLVPEADPEVAPDCFEGEIVCGVDNSRGARSAAQTASALAGRLRLPMALVHAHEPVPPLVMAAAGGGTAVRPSGDLDDEARESSWDLLEALDRATPKPARLRLRSGPPAACLNDYASHRAAPLIVVGAPDRGPLAALLVPSTAWDLARTAKAPVMYVPEGFAPSW
jgi:nucleotide-binding universal stress UspA family protein